MPQPDWKPQKAIRDPKALKRARGRMTPCAACGGPPESVHHVIPRGERGDDVIENLLMLCGNGTMGCHGAEHGNPYTAVVYWTGPNPGADYQERRDAEWVHRAIGAHIKEERPDVIEYVLGKLGDDAGRAYLERRYYLVLPATPTAARSA